MAKSFSQAVDDWASQTEERLDAVYARSVELLGEEMTKSRNEGGRVPFLTGNLTRSLLVSKAGMPNVSDGPFGGSNVGLVAATLKAKETVWLGYQANYAARQNYGYVGSDSLGRVYNQQGAHFVDHAVTNWSTIVTKAIKEVRGS